VLLPTRYQPSGPEARARPSELLRGQTLLILYFSNAGAESQGRERSGSRHPRPWADAPEISTLGFIRMPEPRHIRAGLRPLAYRAGQANSRVSLQATG